jgi:putative ABC transport system permease protein
VLVVLQFVISVIITTYTIVMIMQLSFFQKKSLGFDSENTMVLRMPSEKAILAYPVLKTSLEGIADVRNVSASSGLLGVSITQNGYQPEGMESGKLYNFCAIDEDVLDALKIEVVEGRNFSDDIASDDSAYIINETMAKELGWDQPIGKKIARNGLNHVIGVVKDFHFLRVQTEIRPLILGFSKANEYRYVYVKINAADYLSSISKVEEAYSQVLPSEPFNFQFYHNHLSDNYSELRKSIRVTSIFAIMAIIIACMGLYGLAMFTVERRQREIGVRKVFGAEISQIGKLIVSDFLKWILIANLISIPIAFYYSEKFLQTFPYSIKLNVYPFVITLIVSLFIAVITIGFQVLKLTRIIPVDTLKYE